MTYNGFGPGSELGLESSGVSWWSGLGFGGIWAGKSTCLCAAVSWSSGVGLES